jgi:hypothetical protein
MEYAPSPEDGNRRNFKKLCFLKPMDKIQKRTRLMTQKCKSKKGKVHPRTGHEG